MPISEVVLEDCLLGMSRYKDKFFDLAIVDPPYGIDAPNMQMGTNKKRRSSRYAPSIGTAYRLKNNTKIDWDNEVPDEKYFTELERVSKHQIIFGGNYFPLPPTRGIGCWDKKQPWESFSQWEMLWTSFDCPAFIIRYSNTGGANDEIKIHPTQKPVFVYKSLLKKFAQSGNKILDTHMGSQSSRIAAFNMGFDYWGWEIDKEYFEAGNKRFKEQTAQIKMF